MALSEFLTHLLNCKKLTYLLINPRYLGRGFHQAHRDDKKSPENHLSDYYFQGSDIVEDIFLHKYYNDGKYFPKLSKIYLHNIDSGFKNTLISKYQKELKEFGIELTILD